MKWLTLIALMSMLVLATTHCANAQTMYGVNLVVNGDAESGLTGWFPSPGYDLPVTVAYGTSGPYPTSSDLGPRNRGSSLF